jgi:hypothetical protein
MSASNTIPGAAVSSITSASNFTASSSSRHRRDCNVLLLGCCSLFVLGCSWSFHHGLLLNVTFFNLQYNEGSANVHYRRVIQTNSIALEYEIGRYSDMEKSQIVNMSTNEKNITTTSESSIPKQQQQQQQVKEQNNRNRRPHFVIHVGPHRTGTTFLQASLDQYKVNRHILHQDNYTNLRLGAKSIFQGSGNCWSHDDKEDDGPQYHAHKHAESASLLSRTPPRFMASFQKAIRHLHDQHQNVVWISQGLSKCNVEYVKALADMLNPLFHVRILVSYRRLYEWLPSRFHQVTNGIGGGSDASRRRIVHLVWPDQKLGPQPAEHARTRRTRRRHGGTREWRASANIDTQQQQHQQQPQQAEIRPFERGAAAAMRPFDLERAHLASSSPSSNNTTSPPRGDEFTKLVQAIYKLQQHPAELIRDKYQLFFHDVQVLPLHALHDPFRKETTINNNNNDNNSSSLVSHSHLFHLACSFLPDAKYACKAAQKGLLQGKWIGNSNIISPNATSLLLSSTTTTATSVDHDAIAVAAYQKGWINARTISRADAVQQIARYAHEMELASVTMSSLQSSLLDVSIETVGLINGHNKADSANNTAATAAAAFNDKIDKNSCLDQFYVCPSNTTLHRLLQLSLDTERHLFGINVVQAGNWQEHHRHAFLTAAVHEYNSYCWINVTAVLQNNSWRLFLQSL